MFHISDQPLMLLQYPNKQNYINKIKPAKTSTKNKNTCLQKFMSLVQSQIRVIIETLGKKIKNVSNNKEESNHFLFVIAQ